MIKRLTADMTETMEKRGWKSLDDFRGLLRDRVVAHSKIRRPDADAYHGGYDAEGYVDRRCPLTRARRTPTSSS